MKVAFKTLGCKTNFSETDTLMFESKKLGVEVVSSINHADIYVINSCAVTEKAERDTKREIERIKKNNPNAKIAVIGCYSERFKKDFLKDIHFIAGTKNKYSVLYFLSGSKKLENKTFNESFLGSQHSRAFIKIQDGCNFNCTFCIVSHLRGKSHSLDIEKVLKLVYEAYSLGYNEVVLTGIHLGHYGLDIGSSLDELLKKLFSQTKGPRIRLSTLNPLEISDYMISLLNDKERFCPHFHIGLQSGSDKILKKMGRTYTKRDFIDISEKIYKKYSHTFIGIDIISGFPSETDLDHKETVSLLKDTYWSKLHVFSFSKREGTLAAKMQEQVKESIKKTRVKELKELSSNRYHDFMKSQIGKTFNMLVEKVDKNTFPSGHTENYIPVIIDTKEECVSRNIITCRGIAVENLKLIVKPI